MFHLKKYMRLIWRLINILVAFLYKIVSASETKVTLDQISRGSASLYIICGFTAFYLSSCLCSISPFQGTMFVHLVISGIRDQPITDICRVSINHLPPLPETNVIFDVLRYCAKSRRSYRINSLALGRLN